MRQGQLLLTGQLIALRLVLLAVFLLQDKVLMASRSLEQQAVEIPLVLLAGMEEQH